MTSNATSQPDWLTEEVKGTHLYVQPTAKTLNEAEGRSLTEYLRSRLDDDSSLTGVALDLSKVELITSPAIGALIVIHKRLNGSKRALVLFNLSGMLAEALAFLKLDNVFTICPAAKDVEKALSAR